MSRNRNISRAEDLIRRIALGQNFSSIAFDWGLNLKTVYYHWAGLKAKFGFQCYQDVVRYAIRNKLIRA